MKVLRLLGGDLGWGGAVGTLLLAGFGLVLVVLGVLDLRHVAVAKPAELDCAAWLADGAGPRWVTLTGCQVQVAPVRVAGARRLVTLGARGGEPVLLEVTEPALAEVVTKLAGLPAAELAAYVAAHAADFDELVTPKVVTGWAAPLDGAVEPAAPGAWVLVQGAQPPRGQVVLRLLVGIVALAMALRSLGRRYLVEREADMVTPPEP